MDLSLAELAACPVVHDMLLEARRQTTVGGFRRIIDGHRLKAQDVKGPDGSLYMTRYTALDRQDGGHIYFNCFHRADADGMPHDHPWDSEAMPLNEGYLEEVVSEDGVQTHVEIRPFHVNHIPATKWHRVARFLYTVQPHVHRPVWTIQSTGPYKQSWGFREYTTGRKVYHKGYQTWQQTLHELRTLRAYDLVSRVTIGPNIEAEIKLAISLMENKGHPALDQPLAHAREALRTLELPLRA